MRTLERARLEVMRTFLGTRRHARYLLQGEREWTGCDVTWCIASAATGS